MTVVSLVIAGVVVTAVSADPHPAKHENAAPEKGDDNYHQPMHAQRETYFFPFAWL